MIICPKCLQNYHQRVNFCPKCHVPLPKPGMETTVAETRGFGKGAGGDGPVCDTSAETLPMDAVPPEAREQREAEALPTLREVDGEADPGVASPEVGEAGVPGAQGIAQAHSTGLSRLDTAQVEIRSVEEGEGGPMAAAMQELDEAMEPITVSLRQFVELSLNVNRVLVEGTGTVIDVHLKALTLEPLLDVRLEVDCGRVLNYSIEKSFAQLEHGKPMDWPCEVEFSEKSKGTRLVVCRISFTQLGRRRVVEGDLRITILAKPDSNLSISNVGNQVVHGEGGNAGLGAEHSPTLNKLVDFSKIKTINDLLETELPDNRFRVEMRQVSDEPTGARLIASNFLKTVEPASCLTLVPKGADDNRLPLRLTARGEVAIGRQRDCCDLVSWFLPRSEERDQFTRSLSKVHAVASVGRDGLCFRSRPDTNGAKLNGHELDESEPGVLLEDQGRLSLSAVPGADYLIDLQHHGAAGSPAPEAENHRFWPGPKVESKPVTGCVVFRPVESTPAFRLCIWLLTEAAFGSGEDNPIYLPDSGLASSQGLFHHYRGCFWIENSADSDDGDFRTGSVTGNVIVNGHRLRAGELVPLASGMTVELGNTSYQVELEN